MISKVISSLTQNAVRSSIKSEIAIDKIIEKFKEGCPPKEDLKQIIKQKNQMVTALSSVQGILTSLTKTGQTLEGVITGLQVGVQVIKLLPVPIPPFTPLSVTNTMADTLDTLGDILKKGKGDVGMIPGALEGVIPMIESTISKLNQLDLLINKCVEEQGLTQEEVGELLANDIGPFSSSKDNEEYNKNLLEQLQPGSNNPLLYKGFRLVIQYDPKNEFSFDSRRIQASQSFRDKNKTKKIVLYNLDNNGYSYSSSVEVLINEVKFRIDNFLSNNPRYNRLQVQPTKSPTKPVSKEGLTLK
jgi:hypothetical protein